MSEKALCPACESYTSGIFRAFQEECPCPVCGLPHAAVLMIERAQERHVSDEVTKRIAELEVGFAREQRVNARLRAIVSDARSVLQRDPDGDDEDWT